MQFLNQRILTVCCEHPIRANTVAAAALGSTPEVGYSGVRLKQCGHIG